MYLDASPTQKETRNSFLLKFPRNVSPREKWVNSSKRNNFIHGKQRHVCSQHFHGAQKQGRSVIPIIFPLLPQSKHQKCLPLKLPSKR